MNTDEFKEVLIRLKECLHEYENFEKEEKDISMRAYWRGKISGLIESINALDEVITKKDEEIDKMLDKMFEDIFRK